MIEPDARPQRCTPVAQWKPTCAWRMQSGVRTEEVPGWLMGDDKFRAGHWDEIGAKVA